MKNGFIDLIGKAGKNRGDNFRSQLYVFIVCLLISIFIWSLVRLSRDYFYTINYRIHYTQVPSNLRLTSFSDSVLTLSIRLQGFDFFSEEFLRPRNLNYNVSLRKMKIHQANGEISGYLPTYETGRELTARLNFPSEIFTVFPDTLFFELEKVIPQKVQRIVSMPAPAMKSTSDSLRTKPTR